MKKVKATMAQGDLNDQPNEHAKFKMLERKALRRFSRLYQPLA
jgi:hypothetical protein